MQRRAEFIWTSEQKLATELTFRDFIGDGPVRRDEGLNRWYLFRKSFVLDAVVKSASLDICADSRYIVYVNNRRVGRGPSRSSPDLQSVDTYDVTRQLQVGKNVIAVLVHVYGMDTAWYETVKDYWQAIFGDGGLYCDCQIDELCILSDESWRCVRSIAWNSETPRSGWGQDFIEDVDARQLPLDWTAADFDDRGWVRAQVLVDNRGDDDLAKGFGPVRAYPTTVPRDIPHFLEESISPLKLVNSFGVSANSTLALDKRLYLEADHPCPDASIVNDDAMLTDDDSTTTIRTSKDRDVAILVAFDKLYSGFPFIDIDAYGGEVIEVAVAETYAGEFEDVGSATARIIKRSFLDCAHLFRYTARAGEQRFEKFEWTAVRYMQIVIRNAPNGLRIRHIGCNAISYPVEAQGAYYSSDEFLNQIWKIGGHTVLQCTHDAWEDCPGREKRQWVGDGVVRYPIAAAIFGDSTKALDQRFLMQCMNAQRADGLLQMYAPGDHKTSGVVIPDYSLHYILIAYDYHMQTADLDTLMSVLPCIQKILAWYSRHVGAEHLLVNIPYWHFIEWANVGRQGAATCVNALYATALGRAAEIARRLGIDNLADGYESERSLLVGAINEHLWDAEREVYVDALDSDSGEQSTQVSQQANALLLAFQIAPSERADSIIRYICDPTRVKLTAVPPVVPEGEPFDPDCDVVRCNTFFSHFLYCALAVHGRFDLVLGLIRNYYGPMLESGTTTLWESFDPGASLCHAFSATPVYQLSAFSLGVRSSEAGFSRFVVAPQFGDLEFATGRCPTPHGPVRVQWRRSDCGIEIEIDVPESTSGDFVAPPGFHVSRGAVELLPGRNKLELSEDSADG